ncbi:hypothetical protein PHMEG_00024078 [Phytophthora megakarya]|uniref:Uncharacterized protein n=1 Tax=Phytophthora megakarya TaxID=4795 RepID=A0A225VFK1_9STRA|nr:hypothetical protein PHMEG_00024078 [Phytophthora megakarya]
MGIFSKFNASCKESGSVHDPLTLGQYFRVSSYSRGSSAGHWELMKWLDKRISTDQSRARNNRFLDHELFTDWSKDYHFASNALVNAAHNGHVDVVEWLLLNSSIGFTSDVMEKTATKRFHISSCSNHDLDPWCKCHLRKIPTSFYENQLTTLRLSKPSYLGDYTSAALGTVVENGNFVVLRWLYQNTNTGRLDIVMWLHRLPLMRCTTAAMDNAAAGVILK